MTLRYEHGLTILMVYLRTKSELSRLACFEARAIQTDRQTKRCDQTHYQATFTGDEKLDPN